MKILLIIICVLLAVVVIGFVVLAKKSNTAPDLGLIEGEFHLCLHATNCVNSMESGEASIAPIAFNDTADWAVVPNVITEMGGTIEQQTDRYLRASFRSKWFGFVDDLELLLDTEKSLIHLRSASRVGRSDFSVNRKRVELLRGKLAEMGKIKEE